MAQQPPSSLSTINEILGKEANPMETHEDGTRICKMELFPTSDLNLERSIIIEFIVSHDADSGRYSLFHSISFITLFILWSTHSIQQL